MRQFLLGLEVQAQLLPKFGKGLFHGGAVPCLDRAVQFVDPLYQELMTEIDDLVPDAQVLGPDYLLGRRFLRDAFTLVRSETFLVNRALLLAI